MKKLLAALLIAALSMSGFGLANLSLPQNGAAHIPAQIAFGNTLQLTDDELNLIEGEGPITAIGGAILGGLTGGLAYGAVVEDRTIGGWFVAIVMGATSLAVPAFLSPTP